MPTPTVYLETTVLSYLAAKLSRDLLIRSRQRVTRRWWALRSGGYRLLVSPSVLAEAGQGDPDAAERRRLLLEGLESLVLVPAVETMALRLCAGLRIPKRALADGMHLAFAVHYELDYLLTWNCRHLANAGVARALADLSRTEGFWLPIVCTPETMLGEAEDERHGP
jgi:predicted nucleic acid-binding protein